MRKMFKWLGIGLGALVGLIVLAVGTVYALSEIRFNRTYDIQVEPVAIPADPESVAYGEHIASIHGCKACHGDELSGQAVIGGPLVGVIVMANLTGGAGSKVGDYTVEDWVRSIRHGVGRDGKPLIIMPSNQHWVMSDEDLGALLAYLQSVPPVDNELPELTLGPLFRLLFLAGPLAHIVSAEQIDHDAPRPPTPERGVTAEYGEYLAGLCSICHGPGFSGGPYAGAPPGSPPALNLTPAGELANWTFKDFLTAMRTGVTPGGRQLSDEYMPYQTLFGEMTDEEWEAIWLFLQTLPPKDYGNR
ncbi:MAG: cytochrome c [Anaerolineales bacterium]|nr:cytochrome c [Anaerolineales bacterium]